MQNSDKADMDPVPEVLRPMMLRNLRIALNLRPRLQQLLQQLGYSSKMSPDELTVWQNAKRKETDDGVTELLKDRGIPRYQLPIIEWLLWATDEEVEALNAYCKSPKGTPPRAYYLLFSPSSN